MLPQLEAPHCRRAPGASVVPGVSPALHNKRFHIRSTMQPNSITQATHKTVHQAQREQDKPYHCLYPCIKCSPSSWKTSSAHLCNSQSSKGTSRPGPPPLVASFPTTTTTQRKTVYSEPPEELSQDSVPLELTTATILPPTSPKPDHLPSPRAPSSLHCSHFSQAADSLC